MTYMDINFVCIGYELIERWRHSSTPIDDKYILVVGGCTRNGQVLNDILLIDTDKEIIHKVKYSI